MSDPLWPLTWYYAIYPRRRNDPLTWLGHCDLWGVTRDETWFFLNPDRAAFHIHIAHKAEEVDALWAQRIGVATRILRYEGTKREYRLPFLAPLTCASICGHALGFRAWTPRGLERMLLRNGAQVIYSAGEPDEGSEGRSSSPA